MVLELIFSLDDVSHRTKANSQGRNSTVCFGSKAASHEFSSPAAGFGQKRPSTAINLASLTSVWQSSALDLPPRDYVASRTRACCLGVKYPGHANKQSQQLFKTQSHSMEVLFQFLDDLDDLAIATAFRLQRQFSRRTRERRRVPRTGPTVSRRKR
jgi:hypothetical protein